VVWSNLVANALNAVESGGSVRVVARAEGDTAVLEVTDDGTGIPPDVLPHVFEPFYSTRKDGAGLGLSLVRAIVEQHGGMVSAESDVGRGTTVRVTLPKDGGTGGEGGGSAA
jgi:signal transduction histidine kinase